MAATSSDTLPPDLVRAVYERLRTMAERHMAGERRDHTLGATGLVHEVWVNLESHLEGMRDDPSRFYGAATEAMRRILIDHARRRNAQKRGGGLDRLSLDLVEVAATATLGEVLALDEAVKDLADESERAAEVVRLRFFAGLGETEVAEVMAVSTRTVRREWAFARAWLFQRLSTKEK